MSDGSGWGRSLGDSSHQTTGKVQLWRGVYKVRLVASQTPIARQLFTCKAGCTAARQDVLLGGICIMGNLTVKDADSKNMVKYAYLSRFEKRVNIAQNANLKFNFRKMHEVTPRGGHSNKHRTTVTAAIMLGQPVY